MSNTPQNKLSAAMSEKDILAVKKSIADIVKSMPFLIGLSEGEKKRMTKMNTANKVFVEDVIKTYDSIKPILPNFISVDEVSRDLQLFDQLDEVEVQVEELLEKVRSTRRLAGSEAYSSALMIYQLLKTASKAGVPGSAANYSFLKSRFSQTSSAKLTAQPQQKESEN